jgi:hypothetical protein
MAFTAKKTGEHVFGDLRVTMGTYAGGGETGGDINTGLHQCVHMVLTPGAAAPTEAPAVNETMPCAGDAVTIAVTNNTDGFWMAFGY